MKLTARQRHERNIHVTQTLSIISAQAASIGISPDKAAAIENLGAKSVAKSYSYSQLVGGQTPAHVNGNNGYPSLSTPNTTQLSSQVPTNRNKGRRRLNQYQLGSKQSNVGFAAPKPDWHDKHTLVIAGLDKRFLFTKRSYLRKN